MVLINRVCLRLYPTLVFRQWHRPRYAIKSFNLSQQSKLLLIFTWWSQRAHACVRAVGGLTICGSCPGWHWGQAWQLLLVWLKNSYSPQLVCSALANMQHTWTGTGGDGEMVINTGMCFWSQQRKAEHFTLVWSPMGHRRWRTDLDKTVGMVQSDTLGRY